MAKVDVLTVDDVSFKLFRWWSNWVDVAVFNYSSDGYLLQMSISRTNAKKFKAVQLKGFTGVAHPDFREIGNLTQMEGE